MILGWTGHNYFAQIRYKNENLANIFDRYASCSAGNYILKVIFKSTKFMQNCAKFAQKKH